GEEIILLEVFEAECRSAGGIDLHSAGEAHAAGFVTGGRSRLGGGALRSRLRRRCRRGRWRARIGVLRFGNARRGGGWNGRRRRDGRRGDRRLERRGD